jgi:hypothetical protein
MTDFDWVKARSECSMTKMFMRLKADVEEDVEAANLLFKGTGVKFGFTPNAASFTVYQDVIPLKEVSFTLNQYNISVGDGREKIKFSATLTLNKDKQCRFLLGTEELEGWQFRKKALELLFFSEPQRAADPIWKMQR